MKRIEHVRELRLITLAAVVVIVLTGIPTPTVSAEELDFARVEFEQVWDRTEAPVAEGDVSRSWLWGPEPRTSGLTERYLDSPNSERAVQYFDKGRMEINDPDANPGDPWFVTSGLLTRELVTGQIQIGDNAFLSAGEGAAIHIAGDPLSPFPHYRDLVDVIDQGSQDSTGELADLVLTSDGLEANGTAPSDPATEIVEHVVYHGPHGEDIGYNIPAAIWDYLNAPGLIYEEAGMAAIAEPLFSWIFVMGLPISDPFWAEVSVDGEFQWVLIQPFERRVLTYTPLNPEEWQVEMGNIGQHYKEWRSQFFDPARSGGDPAFFGLAPAESWRYSTSHSVDEFWSTPGTSTSFVPGSELYVREELKLEGRRLSYWSVDGDGAYLHGFDVRDGLGNVRSMVVYSPAIHMIPSEREIMVLTSEVTAISMLHEPEHATIEVAVGQERLVSTPAGVFRTWRIESTRFQELGVDHRQGTAFWFEPEIGIVQWLDNGFSAHLVSSSTLD